MSGAGVIVGDDGVPRCGWSAGSAEYRRYHDEEWATPLHGDQRIFEKVSLEGFQAGLSWITILRRRAAFRRAFADFAIDTVAAFDAADVERLVSDADIIRNRAKIVATIANARVIEELVSDDPGALDRLVWEYATSVADRRRPRSPAEVPATTAESDALSARLRSLGLRFVGPTTVYALMQSGGLVDDHLVGCWRAVDPVPC